MANIALLNTQTHRTLKVQSGTSAVWGDAQRFVPVIVGEFPFLAAHYPILLTKDSDTGQLFVGAMLGFDEGENLFLEESRPYDAYRPLNLQRGPFFTAGSDIAIDLDHPRVGQGQPLFEDDGKPSAYLKSVMALFQELRPGLERTKLFVETLMALKLVEPMDIDVGFDDGTSRVLQDLYTINQEALRALPDDKVVELFRRGYLQLIYLMIGSLKQVPVLARRKNNRLLSASENLFR